jgi:pyocin large subunit-like protein
MSRRMGWLEAATRYRLLPALLVLLTLVSCTLAFAGGKGFRSERQLDQHYAKHKAEFGKITKQEYLRRAQELRDAPLKERNEGDILEARRADGVITRFHRKHGYFGAYNRDGTIRTFFIPVAGERYFRRQAKRVQRAE